MELVNMCEMSFDFVRGLVAGFEYIDDYDEDNKMYTIIILHLIFIRVIFMTEK